MTVSSENRRNDYDGNGVTDTFPFKFMILRPQDLRVVQADQFGAETVLTLDVDYTVHGVGVANGGEIRLTAGPLPVGHHLTLLRNMQLLQSTDLRNQGKYAPETVETALDRIVMTLQQQQEELDRALKVRQTSQEHPDSLIESVKESEAAAAASAAAAGQSAQSAADSAQQAADTLEQSIQEADAILAAAGLPSPIVPLSFLQAKADGSGYDGKTPAQVAEVVGPLIRAASQDEAGIVQLADAATAQGLIDALRVLTPATLAAALQGGNQTLADSGYQKLPGGLILQWGRATIPSLDTPTPVLFPIAFPTRCFVAVAVGVNSDPAGNSTKDPLIQIAGVTETSVTVRASITVSGQTNVDGVHYVAIGA